MGYESEVSGEDTVSHVPELRSCQSALHTSMGANGSEFWGCPTKIGVFPKTYVNSKNRVLFSKLNFWNWDLCFQKSQKSKKKEKIGQVMQRGHGL